MVTLILLFLLNILFIAAVWHITVAHQIQKLGQKKTGGVLKISPEKAFLLSEYALILILFLIDVLFVIMFWRRNF